MSSRLAALALLIVCPRCQKDAWSCQGDDMGGALVCHSCHTSYSWLDGVLDLGNVNEDPNVAEERVAVRRTERNAALGGINDEFEDLSRAEGALKEAILALPYGNNSRYYANRGISATSDQRHLRSTSCWSISSCARVSVCSIWGGSHMVHSSDGPMRVGLLRRGHQPPPVCRPAVRGAFRRFLSSRAREHARRVPFQTGIFNVILAMNALHHAERIEPVAANIARMMKRGGRLAFVEPCCATWGGRRRRHSAARKWKTGISEQTFCPYEWHRAFIDAGLRLHVMRVSEIPSVRSMRRLTTRIATCSPELYDGQVSVLDAPS